MKVIKIDTRADLLALVKELCATGEMEPIALELDGKEIAVIVSSVEYEALRGLEEGLSDKLDADESEKILKDPNWIAWDLLQKQLKS